MIFFRIFGEEILLLFNEILSYFVKNSEIYTQKDKKDQIDEPIIKLSLDSIVTSSRDIDVCKLNDFEVFADMKTLQDADESTLEIRADNQTQTGEIFTATGEAEAERQGDLLRSNTITYNTTTKNLNAKGKVSYFN